MNRNITIILYGFAVAIIFSLASASLDLCANGTLKTELVDPNPRLKDIGAQHQTRCSIDKAPRFFKGLALGYITPWNNHGYDIVKMFPHKFSHASPVWLQIHHKKDFKYKVAGTHDIDAGWVKDVKEAGVKVVPRILFDGWTPQQIVELEIMSAREKLINILINLVKKHNFDGIVLEGWMQLIASGNVLSAMEFVKLLSNLMQAEGKDFILVIPPVRGTHTVFGSRHFDLLADSVTGFSLMTYDYSSRKAGPTSPIKWLKECVEHIVPDQNNPHKSKILLGMNLYGYHFTNNGPNAIVGNQFIDLIKSIKGKMKLNKEAMENFVEIKTKSGKHVIYYPTLYSIKQRLELAEELGVGISLWELGQGFDYFYELL